MRAVVEDVHMMRRIAVTVALLGVALLGVGSWRAAQAACCGCYCGFIDTTSFSTLTACSDSPIDASQCPACPTGEPTLTGCDPDDPPTCNSKPADAEICARVNRTTRHLAPALSPIPLAGLGFLLVGSGVWLTRKRTRLAV